MIVAENVNNPDFEMRVEALPRLSDDQTKVEVEFRLYCREVGRLEAMTTVRPGAVEAALSQHLDVVASAVVDQFAWFDQNFPAMAALMFQTSQWRTLPPGIPSERSSSL